MRPAPPLTRAFAYPVITGIALMALVVTALTLSGRSLVPFVMSSLVFEGEPWRLVTSALPHGDPLHLAFNVLWLWILGTRVEEELGSLPTIGLLLVLAAGSALPEYAVLVGGIGLSGVGYGLVGFLAIAAPRDARFRDAIDRRTLVMFAGWGVLCVVTTVAGVWGVANLAHAAGALLGVLLGGAVARGDERRRIACAAATGLVLAAFVAAVWWRPAVNLSTRSDDDDAYRGYLALKADQPQEALRLYERALRLDRTEASSWYNYAIALGQVRTHRGLEGAAALDAHWRAYLLDPSEPEHRTGLGIELGPLGAAKADENCREAIRLYTAALWFVPSGAIAWNRGLCFERMDEPDLARASLELAVRLAPHLQDDLDALFAPEDARDAVPRPRLDETLRLAPDDRDGPAPARD